MRRATPSHWTVPVASPDQIYARVFEEMEDLARSVLQNARPTVVSLAFPGPIDPAGNALAAPTVFGGPLRTRFPLRNDLVRRWPDARVKVLNDLTAAGYRYLRAPSEDLCVVTVSSGIGHKLFDAARPLGQALASLHLGVGVERFVVIGGFALALGERYRQELVDAMAASAWNLDTDWNAMLELGINDDDAGLLGAGRFAALDG